MSDAMDFGWCACAPMVEAINSVIFFHSSHPFHVLDCDSEYCRENEMNYSDRLKHIYEFRMSFPFDKYLSFILWWNQFYSLRHCFCCGIVLLCRTIALNWIYYIVFANNYLIPCLLECLCFVGVVVRLVHSIPAFKFRYLSMLWLSNHIFGPNESKWWRNVLCKQRHTLTRSLLSLFSECEKFHFILFNSMFTLRNKKEDVPFRRATPYGVAFVDIYLFSRASLGASIHSIIILSDIFLLQKLN